MGEEGGGGVENFFNLNSTLAQLFNAYRKINNNYFFKI